MIYKTLHRQLQIKQHEPHTNRVCSGRVSRSCVINGVRCVTVKRHEPHTNRVCSGRVSRSCVISGARCATVKRHELHPLCISCFDTSVRKYIQVI